MTEKIKKTLLILCLLLCVSGCGYVHYKDFTEVSFLKDIQLDKVEVKEGNNHYIITGTKSDVSEAVNAMRTGFELGTKAVMMP